MDCQPTSSNGILVFVCGNLKVDQEANPVKYSQCFVLLPTAAGGWYVQNGEPALFKITWKNLIKADLFVGADIFRLNYG